MAIKVGVSTVSAALRKLLAEITAYINRVVSDGGTVVSESDANKVVRWLKQHDLLASTELLYLSTAGLSIRDAAGNLQFVEKVYSLDQNLTPNDGTQAVELNQPRLVGGIAPRSKVALSNQNGENRFLTHPEISFGATDAWSVSVMLNNNATTTDNYINGVLSGFRILATNFLLRYSNTNPAGVSFVQPMKPYIGKNTVLTFVANGNGELLLYVNGVYIEAATIATNSTFQYFLGNGSAGFNGKSHYYRIQSGAMTPAQITAEYDLLRSWIPEIESVTIGSQEWSTRNFEAVATPEGNVIANVTDNTTWASATTLYDNAYAAESGTEDEKIYAGLKAAAMWCYYNNSADNGAIYGKLYNWYAAKLLDLDMLSAGFGWRITQDADWPDLDPNSSDAALKYTGENFWETGNIATNEDGLTVLGGGFRNESGYFFALKDSARVWNSDETTDDKRIGASIRLIKTE